MAAAWEAFARSGYEDTRTPEIAAAAEVAEGTLFLHFENKLGLLAGVMDAFYAKRLLAPAAAIAAAAPDPRARLVALLRDYVRTLGADWRLIRAFGQRGRLYDDAFHERFKANNRAFTRVYLDAVTELRDVGAIRADIEPRLVRDAILGAAEHYVASRLGAGLAVEPDAFTHQLLAMIFSGLEPRR
ncbi:MAG: TetR family transcriptional regulator [Pseudomonadota bacterium]